METKLYHFIGSESEIGDRKLERFGAEVRLTDAAALNAIEGGAQLCPAEAFNFTEQEVSLYPFPAFRANAPEAFKEKHKAALIAVANHLATLKAQKEAPVG